MQIEELAQTIIRNQRFRHLLKQSIKQTEFQIKGMEAEAEAETQTLQNVLDEINRYLMELTEVGVSDQNNENYMTFLRKSEEMHLQQEKMFQNMLTDRISQLKKELDDKIKQIGGRPSLKKALTSNLLQLPKPLHQERRRITKNILQCSQINIALYKSFDQSKRVVDQDQQNTNPNRDHSFNNNNRSGSEEILSINNKLSEMEVGQSKKFKEFSKKIEEKMKQIDQSSLKISLSTKNELKLEIEERLSASFQGIWNVISNLENKINRCQLAVEHADQK